MHSFMDAKLMAKLLRQSLAERGIALTHSDCLEIVARQFGLGNWNILSARIEALTAAQKPLAMPEGWHDASVNRDGYFRMGLDPERPGCAVIASTALADHAPAAQFGTLAQSIDADAYAGGSVRVSAQLSCQHLDGAGSIWLRIDGDNGRGLRFDNLMDQPGVPVSGSHAWKDFSITLEVPNAASIIYFGFLMRGRGSLWARNFAVERLDSTTEPRRRNGYRNDRPTNLGFGG